MNPETYRKHLERNRLRYHRRRAEMSPEELAEFRRVKREQVARWRLQKAQEKARLGKIAAEKDGE